MLSGVTSSRPSQWHWRRPLTTALNEVSGATCTKPYGDRGPPVQRPRTMLYGARRRVWPGIPSSSRCTRKNSGARGLTGSTRSGRRNGTSGAPWSRLSTTRSSCRRLMFLCRRWRTNCWRCADSSILLFPSRLSTCPRSPLHPVIAGAVCASRSRWRNSWWKCRRSYRTPRCTVLWSRTWTFNSLTFQFRVVAEFFILHRRLPVCRVRQIKGVFALFPREKVRRCTQGRNWVRTSAHPRRRLSWRISSRMQLVCGCGVQVVGGNFWARTQKSGSLGEAGTGPRHASAYECFWMNFLSIVLVQFALGNWSMFSFVLASGSYCSGRLGIAEEYGNLDFSGDVYFRWCNMFFGGFGRIHTLSTWRQARILKRFFSIRFEWRSVPSRCFGCS